MSRFKENSIYSDQSKSQQITTASQATKKLLYFLSDSLGIDDLKRQFDSNKLEEQGYDLFSKQLPNFLAAFQLLEKDEDLKKSLACLIQYGRSLENQIRNQKKEITRLEYLNKYLILSLQKRDEMFGLTLQENRKLKESTIFLEKTLQGNLAMRKNHYKSKPNLNQTTREERVMLKTVGKNPRNRDFSILLSPYQRKSILPALANNPPTPNTINDFSIRNETYSKISDPKMQNFLNPNMSLYDMQTLYDQKPFIIFFKNLFIDETRFIDQIPSFEPTDIINLLDHIKTLFFDQKNLFYLVHQLKKLIKAAHSMAESMVLGESMERIVDETSECLECDRASVFLVDRMKEELWSKVAKGSDKTIRIPLNSGIVGYVATKGEIVNILNAYADERFNREIDKAMNYKTNNILCAPILSKTKEVVGVIQAINKTKGQFTNQDEGLISLLANLAGTVLTNSMQFGEQTVFHSNLRHVLQIGIHLNSYKTLQDLIPNAEKKLQNLMNVERHQVKIFLSSSFSSSSSSPSSSSCSFLHYNSSQPQVLPICGIAGEVFKGNKYIYVANPNNNPLFNGLVDINTNLPLICLPINLLNSKKTLGVFQVPNARGVGGDRARKNDISAADLELLEFFSNQIAQMIFMVAGMKDDEAG